MKNVVVLGPPGVGKGTQAKRVEARLGSPHIASGDILRDIRRQNTPLANEVKGYMDRGQYVPDELMNKLVLGRLSESDALRGFLLDGFPRTLAQAQALDRAMDDQRRPLDLVIYMTAPADVLERRIADRIICPQCHAIYNSVTKPPRHNMQCDLCGHALERRTDQAPDIIRTRLHEFIRQTEPLVEHYRAKGLLVEVDGARPMETVEHDIDAALKVQGVA